MRRVGFLDSMKGTVKVFLDKNGERKEVEVEKRTKNGKEWFWFKEKSPEPQQEHPEEKQDDGSVTEEEVPMVEVRPEESQVERMMWLAERVTTREWERRAEKGSRRNGGKTHPPRRHSQECHRAMRCDGECDRTER